MKKHDVWWGWDFHHGVTSVIWLMPLAGHIKWQTVSVQSSERVCKGGAQVWGVKGWRSGVRWADGTPARAWWGQQRCLWQEDNVTDLRENTWAGGWGGGSLTPSTTIVLITNFNLLFLWKDTLLSNVGLILVNWAQYWANNTFIFWSTRSR